MRKSVHSCSTNSLGADNVLKGASRFNCIVSLPVSCQFASGHHSETCRTVPGKWQTDSMWIVWVESAD